MRRVAVPQGPERGLAQRLSGTHGTALAAAKQGDHQGEPDYKEATRREHIHASFQICKENGPEVLPSGQPSHMHTLVFHR